ncbi:hypothetical protein [Lysobacter sp. F60174L2]|uniref:hypothetical protein n=1 Tax=Lysobacter sp. F60174L2 TaxID=3459295 RepID=UPI00403DDD74
MANKERYSMKIGSIGQEEIDLLECLLRIDMRQALDSRAGGMRERLIEEGLVDSSDGELSLTIAGIERCQSLQHRIAGDKEAAKVLADRGIAIAISSDQ